MPRSPEKIKKEIKVLKKTIKIFERPENLDLDVINKIKELIKYLEQELS